MNPAMKTGLSRLIALLLVLTFHAGFPAWAQRHPPVGDQSMALVIGNGAYGGGIPGLANPGQDAAALATMTNKLGFQTVLLKDANLAELRAGLAAFGRAARDARVVVVFYSGHGMELDGRGVILPVDFTAAGATSSKDLLARALPISEIDAAFAGRRGPTLIFLDACRSDPLADDAGGRGIRVGGMVKNRGLAADAGQYRSTFVYATEPGQVAYDGVGQFSPFTTALLQNLPVPNVQAGQLLSLIRLSVSEATDGAQNPAFSLSGVPSTLVTPGLPQTTQGPLARIPSAAAPPASSLTRSVLENIPVVYDQQPLFTDYYCAIRRRKDQDGAFAFHEFHYQITMTGGGLACGKMFYSEVRSRAAASNMKVTQPPAHGRVVIRANAMAYIPEKDFRGADRFMFTFDYVKPIAVIHVSQTVDVTVR